MDNLIIEEEHDAPYISLDASTKVLDFIGKSYMEDAASFYTPILEWLQQYLKENKSGTTLNLDLQYFNSTTSKYLLKILFMFSQNNHSDLKVCWFYHKDDELIRERGRELQIMVGMEFEHQSYV